MQGKIVHIGSDHAGVGLKGEVVSVLKGEGWEVVDHGTYTEESCDYPDYAHATAEGILADGSKGILICGSANGVCITANKHKGVRAALCWNEEVAKLARQHNDANVICLPARFISRELAMGMVKVFLSTAFEGGRHQKRVEKIDM
jgi:ribose 5-phosphate isomerase B